MIERQSESLRELSTQLGAWIEDLPLPAAVMFTDGAFIGRNPVWMNLDPIHGLPFAWPLDFFARVQQCLQSQQPSVLRAIASRDQQAHFDLWLGPIAQAPSCIWIVAADVSIYRQDALADLIDAEVRNASAMIKGILHEMRNPLAGIKTAVQLLQRRYNDANLRDELEQILRDVSRIDVVFQELTLLGGGLNLRLQPSNLHRVIDEAWASVARAAEQRGISLCRDFDPSLPELNIDPDRMYRVYLNLLRNAIQASPDGATVIVKTQYENRRLAAPEGGRLRARRAAWVTRVIDSGSGIDEASKTLLFTPMYTTKAQGTGLGLPISLQIVQAHGGVLTLENRADGKGAVATVALPITGG